MKFRIITAETVFTVFEVEANNKDEAKDLVLCGNVEWQFQESDNYWEIIECEVIE